MRLDGLFSGFGSTLCGTLGRKLVCGSSSLGKKVEEGKENELQ